MNDRFKSRFFHKPAGKYLTQTSLIYCDGRYHLVSTNRDSNPYILISLNESEIIEEQCTGLKDRNGELIYEGDIVAKIDINGFGYPRIRICRVYWKEDWLGWAIETEYDDVYALGEYGSDNFEVIGNIHEDKDLLEQED